MRQYVESEIREHYRLLTEYLIRHNLYITTMESATSGQIASLITDTQGASAIMKGAFITYSNEAKILQGVPEEVIDRYSVYSIETAKEMARACREAYGADVGIGVTGTMGNIDPANAKSSSIGEVYFAISLNNEIKGYHIQLPAQPSRLAYKLAVAEEVYQELRKLLKI